MAHRQRLFVDANVFIALLNKDDSLHGRATNLWSELDAAGYILATSNVVVSEAITVLSQRASRELAHVLAETMYANTDADIELLYSEKATEQHAYTIFKKTKGISFVDAIILALMDMHDIDHLASFDRVLRKHNHKHSLPTDF
jgi:predicted nucleic acid-binding protein